MEYSVQKDAIFCYPCHIFAVTSGDNEETFTKTGFNNWKKVILYICDLLFIFLFLLVVRT